MDHSIHSSIQYKLVRSSAPRKKLHWLHTKTSGHWRHTCSRPPGAIESLRHLHDFGAAYKYPDLLTYLQNTLQWSATFRLPPFLRARTEFKQAVELSQEQTLEWAAIKAVLIVPTSPSTLVCRQNKREDLAFLDTFRYFSTDWITVRDLRIEWNSLNVADKTGVLVSSADKTTDLMLTVLSFYGYAARVYATYHFRGCEWLAYNSSRSIRHLSAYRLHPQLLLDSYLLFERVFRNVPL